MTRTKYLIGPRTRHEVLEYIRAHPGCSRLDIADALSLWGDQVYEVVVALSVRNLAYQNQETRCHYSIVEGWAR
jgi:hypothetical protein